MVLLTVSIEVRRQIAQVLASRRVPPCITRSIMAMLEQRSAQVELGDARIKVRVKKGLELVSGWLKGMFFQ